MHCRIDILVYRYADKRHFPYLTPSSNPKLHWAGQAILVLYATNLNRTMNRQLTGTQCSLLLLFFLFQAVLAWGQDFTDWPLNDLSSFRPAGDNWKVVGDVMAVLETDEAFKVEKGGGILVNLPTEKQRSNLVSVMEYGDLDLELEFMMARHSNSGIYLQGKYEVQLLDSWGKQHPTYGDCGGIYERWDDNKPDGQKGYEGYPPRVNACRAPGLWQKLEISFQAPRFDLYGNKTANARILYIRLNGETLHENIELTGPTRGGGLDEVAQGPLLIQGDHGPVAFRNIRYRTFGSPPVQLRNLKYEHYYTEQDVVDMEGLSLKASGPAEHLTHEVVNTNEKFLLRFQGDLEIKTPGRYYFELAAFGWGWLQIGDKLVLGRGPWTRTGSVELQPGTYPLDLRYAKTGSWFPNGIGLFVAGPGLRRQALHVPSSLPPSLGLSRPIHLNFQPEPVIHRSFMDFKGLRDSTSHRITHPVSVGFSEGVSYSYNLSNGSLFQAWKGGFLDVTPMWDSRGDGSSRPLGSVLSLEDAPALAVLENEKSTWPVAMPEAANFRSKGYHLDGEGQPDFLYELYGVKVSDKAIPMDGGRKLERHLQLEGASPQGLYCRLAVGKHIGRMPDNTYAIDKRYYIQLPEKGAAKVSVRTIGEWQELVAPLDVAQQLSYFLIW